LEAALIVTRPDVNEAFYGMRTSTTEILTGTVSTKEKWSRKGGGGVGVVLVVLVMGRFGQWEGRGAGRGLLTLVFNL